MGKRSAALWLALGAIIALGVTPSAFPRQAGAGALHIHELRGTIKRVGAYRPYGPLYAVELRATICLRSAAEALRTYPDEFRVTHYAVTRKPRRWWRARDVRDKPHWMVSFGEKWNGKPCGSVWLEDPIPPSHANLHSLGNDAGCYGVALEITAGRDKARKRVIVKCGPRF